MIQHPYHCLCGTRCKSSLIPGKNLSYVNIAHAIHILIWMNDRLYRLLIQMIRKRMEQKNSMDRRILVDLLEFFLKLPLADVLRKLTHPTFDTDQFHSFFCASFIGQVIRSGSDPDDRKTGEDSLFL